MQEFPIVLFVSLIIAWLGAWVTLWLYRRNKFIPFDDAIELLADKTKWYEEVMWNNLISKEEYTREHLMRFVRRDLLNIYGKRALKFEDSEGSRTLSKRRYKIPKEHLTSPVMEWRSYSFDPHSIKIRKNTYFDFAFKAKGFNHILNSPDLWIEPEKKKEPDFKHLLVTKNEKVPEGFIGVRLVNSPEMFSGPYKVEGFMGVKMESSDGNI